MLKIHFKHNNSINSRTNSRTTKYMDGDSNKNFFYIKYTRFVLSLSVWVKPFDYYWKYEYFGYGNITRNKHSMDYFYMNDNFYFLFFLNQITTKYFNQKKY